MVRWDDYFMKIFLISDNHDTHIGLRLVGVDGVVVKTPQELKQEIQKVLENEDIGLLLIMERLCRMSPNLIDDIKLHRKLPLVVEIPGSEGSSRGSDFISTYVREAIGIKI